MLIVLISLALAAIAAGSVAVIAASLKRAFEMVVHLRGEIAALDSRDAFAAKLETSGQPECRLPTPRLTSSASRYQRAGFSARLANA